MPITDLMPNPKQQYFLAAGIPLVGGKIYTYAAGTSTPKATYTDVSGTIPQANPIILNSRGEPSNAIYWSGSYKVEIRDALNNLIYTVDNFNTIFSSLSGPGGASLINYGSATLSTILATHFTYVVNSIAALSAIDTTLYSYALVTGYYAAGDGGGGNYYLDAADVTTPTNGGTVIAAIGGGRWKLQRGGLVSPRQFGAKGDFVADDTDALNRWTLYLMGGNAATNQHAGYGAAGTYKVTGAGWQVPVGDYMPNLFTDGADQFVIKGSVSPLMTISATGGSGMIPTVTWEGIKLDGVATGANEGVRVAGACFFTGRGWHFYRLGTAIRMYNIVAATFTEGVVFEDAYFDTSVTTWLQFSKSAGDASFRSSGLRNFKGNLGATAGPAILIDAGCVPYFGPMSGIIWCFNPNGVFIRNNSSQVPFIGNLDTETQAANTNKLTLADNAGSGYVFLQGSVSGWNYGSANLHLGKLVQDTNYFNANTGEGQMFQADTMSGQVVSTALGQRLKVPLTPGLTKPYLQWAAMMTVCATYTNGYYWQGVFLVLPGATDNIINSTALQSATVNNAGLIGAMTVSQGNDFNAWFDNPNLPAGGVLSYTIKYINGLIPQ